MAVLTTRSRLLLIATGSVLLGVSGCDQPSQELEPRAGATPGTGVGPAEGGPPACEPVDIEIDYCGEDPPPPPAIGGECNVELLADWIMFTKGQGASEGKAEGSVTYLLTDQDTGGMQSESLPRGGGSIKLTKEKRHTLGQSIASYTVLEGKEKDVEVCARFREHDDDVLNGKDDLGSSCKTITLTCPQDRDGATLSADLCRGGNCNNLNGAMSTGVKVLTADADRDCVPNEDDYTPEPCDEELKGQLCRASLVYFYYGDGAINDLAQNFGTDLTKAMTGYDRVVLLLDQAHLGPFGLNNGEVDAANVVMAPTEQNFFAGLQDLTARGCDIDTWMFSHGGVDWVDDGGFAASGGGYVNAIADDDGEPIADITSDELTWDTDPINSGTSSVPVRMTYSTACFYEEWNAAWMGAGAKVTSGSIDVSFFPQFFGNFADAWDAGAAYQSALVNEVDPVAAAGTFAYLEALGTFWGGCFGKSVMDQTACARDFFVDSDLMVQLDANSNFIDGPDEAKFGIGGPLEDTVGIAYDSAETGLVNVVRSSGKVMVGAGAIRKYSPATLVWP